MVRFRILSCLLNLLSGEKVSRHKRFIVVENGVRPKLTILNKNNNTYMYLTEKP